MKTPLLCFFATFLLTSPALAQRPVSLYPDIVPVRTPDDLRKVALPHTTLSSVVVNETEGSVRITAVVTHPPATDRVTVWVALPLKNWNGRFMGNGGGGFNGGSANSLRGPVAQGLPPPRPTPVTRAAAVPSLSTPTVGSTGRRSATTPTSASTR